MVDEAIEVGLRVETSSALLGEIGHLNLYRATLTAADSLAVTWGAHPSQKYLSSVTSVEVAIGVVVSNWWQRAIGHDGGRLDFWSEDERDPGSEGEAVRVDHDRVYKSQQLEESDLEGKEGHDESGRSLLVARKSERHKQMVGKIRRYLVEHGLDHRICH
ncbi:MAG: hypothetical protein M1817_003642 [Caeruleum heppii]|nr:MAG: hypothetical protein M1817_003642 [Caeruleum heppii]